MTGTDLGTEYASWRAAGHPKVIEYPASLLNQLRDAAVEGFNRLPHGGIEIGGVLFGVHRGDVIRILAFRPLACEYAFGPGFVLSQNDQAGLEKLLQDAARDPDLQGLEPVGWYHSHTRSEIFLSERDLEIYNRFFPHKWQIALVLRPVRQQPARAGFFFREGDGSIRTESSHGEFVLEPAHIPRLPAADSPAETTERPPFGLSPPPPADGLGSVPFPEPPLAPPPPALWQPRTRSSLKWLWAAVPLCLLALGGMLVLRTDRSPASGAALSLQVTDVDGQLRIQWDRTAQPIREATGGSLEILDGGERTEVLFDGQRLRQGSVTYARRSEKVDLRLRVDRPGRRPAEESVRFLGPPPPGTFPPELQPAREEALAREIEKMRAELEQKRIELRQNPIRPGSRFRQPPPARSAGSQPGPLPQPPGPLAQSSPLPIPSSPVPPLLGRSSQLPPPAAREPLRAESAPARPVYSGPMSGRVIWAGQLPPGAQVTIDGRRCSRGSVTAELPGVPVRIRVYPADLSSKGITVFTANARSANLTEPPGPQNGWNRTTYAWDQRRANDVVVLEAPGPQNNWKGVILRSEQPLSLIVVDWQVVRLGPGMPGPWR